MLCDDKKHFHTLIFVKWSNLSKIGDAYIQLIEVPIPKFTTHNEGNNPVGNVLNC